MITKFIIQLLIFLSNTDATNKQQFCIFYRKILIIAIIIVPFLTIGRYKNKRYANDKEYRARIDSMNENPQTAQAFKPTAEAAGH